MGSSNGCKSSSSYTAIPKDYITANSAPKCTWHADPTKCGCNCFVPT